VDKLSVKKEHPWQARVMHYIHWISMVVLVVSGFYIHFPWTSGYMAEMRYLHFLFMYILAFNWVVRVYWAIFGSERDIRNFLPEEANRGKLLPLIRYYLFLEEKHPRTAKYNPLQKMTYVFWFFLVFLQGLTGFSLYWPGFPLFASFNQWVGGLAVMRSIHYLIMWVFLVTVALHIYLSLAEDFRSFLNMFFALPYEKK
jgi:Ni/Fe-hydrogenase 1 B-type cytochrome subunit